MKHYAQLYQADEDDWGCRWPDRSAIPQQRQYKWSKALRSDSGAIDRLRDQCLHVITWPIVGATSSQLMSKTCKVYTRCAQRTDSRIYCLVNINTVTKPFYESWMLWHWFKSHYCSINYEHSSCTIWEVYVELCTYTGVGRRCSHLFDAVNVYMLVLALVHVCCTEYKHVGGLQCSLGLKPKS